MAGIIEVNKDTFDQEVKEACLPVLVDFWGPKCVPCLGLMPIVEEMAIRYAGKIKFCKVNTAENRRLAIQLRVLSLPTFLFFKNGELTAKLDGDFGADEIEAQLKELIN